MKKKIGTIVKIEGIVQGVGFRPFVYSLAKDIGLTGWVRNTSGGVEIEVNGFQNSLEKFLDSLQTGIPPLARIDNLTIEHCDPSNYPDFSIIQSKSIQNTFQPVSPDVSICPDCLIELFDPTDRRYLYPFINCTNCGPRFTIIKDIPYDRPKTTMAEFSMCHACSIEYNNPLDRRFHAQPIACPDCGPHVWIEKGSNHKSISKYNNNVSLNNFPDQVSVPALVEAQQLLAEGNIIAVKGLGGFHLACNAFNPEAVRKLRDRKLRVDKPFAVMFGDISTVSSHCYVNLSERNLLESRERPIVVLQRNPASTIAAEVSPNQNTIGVMLPYTPLHYLLFAELGRTNSDNTIPAALIMTSGNLSEEPIAVENIEAEEKLSSIADAFLLHNRLIYSRCDDSVYRIFIKNNIDTPSQGSKFDSNNYPLRRSRGFAPNPFILPFNSQPILATGADLKNTFGFLRDKYAIISHHIGDLENYETLISFEEGISHYESLFRIHPKLIAHDLHPDYFSTRYALKRSEIEGIRTIGIQHHHAHVASCMVENGFNDKDKVIGISFDGTGYGTDAAIWGGEILLSDYKGFQRLGHLEYVPLPGGDLAIREPWRMALSWLQNSKIEWSDSLPPVRYALKKYQKNINILDVLNHQIQTGINTPQTSSVGRLFDAFSALIGIRETVNYEAQAAIELEAIINPDEQGFYPIQLNAMEDSRNAHSFSPFVLDPTLLFQSVVTEIGSGVPISTISARFHNSMSEIVLRSCQIIRDAFSVNTVALSGGVWQNTALLSRSVKLLNDNGFTVLIHKLVPSNDGGLSLGQAVIASKQST